MSGPEEDLFLVAGPPGAGKTLLVGALQQAVLNRRPGGSAPEIRVRPTSPATRALFEAAGEAVRSGVPRVGASHGVEEHRFEFTIGTRSLFGSRERKAAFLLLDGPGGALFRTGSAGPGTDQVAMGGFRARLVQALKVARGIVLCADAAGRDPARSFYADLPGFLAEAGMDRLPASRVVLALTKADLRFLGEGRGALARVRSQDPLEGVREVLGRVVLRSLASYLAPEAEVAVTWCSAYGFVEDEGIANFDPHLGGLLVAAAGGVTEREAIETWRPFQVLESFSFLAGGEGPGMTRVRASGLAG